LSEIALHFKLTPQAIFYPLKRLKITRKKKFRLYKVRNKETRTSFIEALKAIT